MSKPNQPTDRPPNPNLLPSLSPTNRPRKRPVLVSEILSPPVRTTDPQPDGQDGTGGEDGVVGLVPMRFRKPASKRKGEKQVAGWEGVNVTKLAKELGYWYYYVTQGLTGRRKMGSSAYIRIAAALGWTPHELVAYIQHVGESRFGEDVGGKTRGVQVVG